MKIQKNVIAMIVIMGITVIPTLYAWFNISASWDPYGNTGALKLAVASDDKGYRLETLRRGFFPLPDGSELYLCRTNCVLSDKGARSARLGVLPSRTPFEPILWIPIVNRQTEMPGSLKLRVINTLSGSMKSKTFASTSYSAKPDWNTTAAVLSSKESSPKSS